MSFLKETLSWCFLLTYVLFWVMTVWVASHIFAHMTALPVTLTFIFGSEWLPSMVVASTAVTLVAGCMVFCMIRYQLNVNWLRYYVAIGMVMTVTTLILHSAADVARRQARVDLEVRWIAENKTVRAGLQRELGCFGYFEPGNHSLPNRSDVIMRSSHHVTDGGGSLVGCVGGLIYTMDAVQRSLSELSLLVTLQMLVIMVAGGFTMRAAGRNLSQRHCSNLT